MKSSSYSLLLSLGLASGIAHAGLSLTPLSSVQNGLPADLFEQSAAEIVKFDVKTQRMFVVNGKDDTLDIFDASNPSAPVLVRSVDLSAYGNPNSVDVNPRKKSNEVAVAIGAPDKTQRGKVAFLNTNGDILEVVEVGYLPDMLTYDHDGQRVVVANEAEPADDYSVDPQGSVSIIRLTGGKRKVTEVSFTGLTADDVAGVRISGPQGTTIAQDLEPEYVAISPNDRWAFVTCQENNAVLKIDLAKNTVAAVLPLGSIDYSQLGNAIDGSDKDLMVRVANWPVRGLFMPDSIATYTAGKKKDVYFVTANEGDSRAWGSYADEARIKSLTLDPSAFPLGDSLKLDTNIGRLNVIKGLGDVDGDGDYDQLFTFGTRSFSIFSEDGQLVFNSGEFFETYFAQDLPDSFNVDHVANASFDTRSDNKGPEPESIKIGTIGERTFAFVGLERMSSIMVFDITDPRDVRFETQVNNRNFEATDMTAAGDLGPEGIDFVPAASSPTGKPLLCVANEISGTTTIYEISDLAAPAAN